ncbi:MBL fold metallo-hydrolase [Actinomadura namibiensis]|uniref:Ribonuclease BN (tRNA processing enzyme) n=1 Tax=Actinomadura namibiensis TaxID=182080 RepID=A0A7W3LNI3_ACTNM|nr:MBL fold metallo-hydrolase [Actinomadura namibiensis]MBA8951285.1 ribonuclease BN (tRNA processing enzyme) [Actinomadura namibiensis]
MRVTVIGCSGSYPGPDSPASSYLVQAEGYSLVIDLGNGALGTLQQHASLYEIDAVCVSHLHADHCLDLCGYWVARTYCPTGPLPRLPVYGPTGTAARMARAYDLDPEPGMTNTFDFRELERTFELGPFRITTSLMPHPVEAFAFRVEHDGRVLAYSGDTGPADELVKVARGADLFLCEASFLEGPGNPPDLHLTAREAGEHAARADVGRLVLTHLVPWNDADRSLTEAKGSGYDGPIDRAHVGAVYDL